MPVGFKWFVGGLLDGTPGFAGEDHMARIVSDAQSMVDAVLEAGTRRAGGGPSA
ncbi:hypothetical protein ACPUER_09085 [Burkholderia sp. DN3021]|uniref:hypothetical protein n=1 Tax=Burkholderia sp. DN3021 TaxID=3410137 RepID=UPI003C7A527B